MNLGDFRRYYDADFRYAAFASEKFFEEKAQAFDDDYVYCRRR